jgi:Protein of unknown function (DUF3298)
LRLLTASAGRLWPSACMSMFMLACGTATPTNNPARPTVTAAALQDEVRSPIPYRYRIVYPAIQPTVAGSSFNAVVADWAKETAAQFLLGLRQYPPASGAVTVGENRLECGTRPAIWYRSVVSFRIDCVSASAISAHPSVAVQTFDWDYQKHRLLKLNDLFRPNASYLLPAKQYADQVLRQRYSNIGDYEYLYGSDVFVDANYEHFMVTSAGLIIIFDQYAVAPGSAGQPEVTIPYDTFHHLIAPNGPIGDG